jgi:hypothetical protein
MRSTLSVFGAHPAAVAARHHSQLTHHESIGLPLEGSLAIGLLEHRAPMHAGLELLDKFERVRVQKREPL